MNLFFRVAGEKVRGLVVYGWRSVATRPCISLFIMSLSGFDIKVMLASLNEFGSIPFICILSWNSLRRIGMNSLNVW